MQTSQTGIDLIKHFEGYRPSAYQDSVNVWTIGYGHTSAVKPGMTITRLKAEELLRQDVKHVEDALNSHGLRLSQNQFDALVSLFFNVGTAWLTQWVPALKSDPNSPSIAERFMKYTTAGGKVLSGLVARRTIEAEMYKKKILL